MDRFKNLVSVGDLTSCSPDRLFTGFFISLGFLMRVLQTKIITVNQVFLSSDRLFFSCPVCVWWCLLALQCY